MEPVFWHQVWQQGQLGFQLAQAHPMLCAQLSCLPVGGQVFVPLCGKSPDLHSLAQQYQVIGAELSHIACRDFFAEAQILASQNDAGAFTLWQGGQYQLWQGDFFELPSAAVEGCQVIYDRAALIALPAEMRQRYVQKLRSLFPKATLLLISLEYPEHEKQGPPFSVATEEIYRLFDFARVELCGLRNLTGQGFARRKFDTTSLLEKSWLIHW
jgi:thiopurine S-methyltransferase